MTLSEKEKQSYKLGHNRQKKKKKKKKLKKNKKKTQKLSFSRSINLK